MDEQTPIQPSQRFELNKADMSNSMQTLIVMIASVIVTYAPTLMDVHYVYKGHDYTYVVLPIVAGIIDVSRRFVSCTDKK